MIRGNIRRPASRPTTVEVWADIVCSWCYVGKRHLETALEAFPAGSVELRWRSFELDPTIPADAGSEVAVPHR